MAKRRGQLLLPSIFVKSIRVHQNKTIDQSRSGLQSDDPNRAGAAPPTEQFTAGSGLPGTGFTTTPLQSDDPNRLTAGGGQTPGRPMTSRSNLTTKVTLAARDVNNLLKNNGFAWFNRNFGNHSLPKYLKARVIQCVDSEMSKILTDNPEMMHRMTNGTSNPGANTENVIQTQYGDMQVRTIELIDNSEGHISEDSAHNAVAADGTVEIEKEYEVEFTNVPETGHVSYFTHVFLDTEEMIQDHNLNMATPTSNAILEVATGKADSVVLMEGNNITGKRVVYQTSTNEGHFHYYTLTSPTQGVVHDAFHPDNPLVYHGHRILDGKVMMASSQHIDPALGAPPHAHTLLEPSTAVLVYDDTKMDKLEKAGGRIDSEPSAELQYPDINTKVYISPGYFSRDKCNNYHGFFAVNMHEVAKKESRYNQIHNTTDSFLERLEIKSVKIFRQRANDALESDRLGFKRINTVAKTDFLREINIAEKTLIAELGRERSPRMKGTVRRMSNVYTEFNNTGVLNFTFSDFSISSITDGHYVYSVEMIVVDKTNEVLSEVLGELKSLRKEVGQYLNLFEQVSGGKIPRTAIANINPNMWVSRLKANFQLFGVLFGSGMDEQGLADAAQLFLSPNTATQEGIQKFIRSIDNFIKKIGDLIGTVPGQPSVSAGSSARPIKVSQKDGLKNIIFLSKTFTDLVDATIPLGIGYEYLCIDEECAAPVPTKLRDTYPSLGSISQEDYMKRLDAEMAKFVGSVDNQTQIQLNVKKEFFNPTKGPSIPVSGINLTSYLTPCTVHAGDNQPVDVLTDDSPGKYSDLEILVLTRNSYNNFCRPRPVPPPIRAGKSKREKQTKDVVEMLSSMRSVSVESGTPAEQQMIMCTISTDATTDTKEYTDIAPEDKLRAGEDPSADAKRRELDLVEIAAADLLLPSLDTFVFNGFEEQTGGLVVTHPDVHKELNDATKYELASTDNSLLQTIRARKTQNVADNEISSELSSLPVQVKSLFNNVKTDNNVSIGLDRSTFNFKYRMIMCVSYLAGFQTTRSNGSLISSPVFKQLTSDVLEKAGGRSLICRMTSWSKPDYGIVPVKGLELGVYHEIFIIRSTGRYGLDDGSGRITRTTMSRAAATTKGNRDY